MDHEPPDSYELLKIDVDGEDGLRARFRMDDGAQTVVTYFPDKKGVRISADDDPGYDEGKKRAAFGVVLIKIITSGLWEMREL